ncbi:unnamed protein product [[Actinomadura] parvosata subsp. kistnae]|nr:unnamed protein product [Actinomadura parvosata subsp. kistnae]
MPALTLSYSANAVNADLLGGPVEVAVEWSIDGQTWMEGPDARFLRIKQRGDGTDRAGMKRFELPGYVWQLRKLLLFPGAAPLVEGKRAFLSATPGAILATFLQEGQARGAAAGFSWDFTPTHDSAGQPWAKILTIYYQPGIDALTTLINLAEQGTLDFRMAGRTLQVYNADTELGRDLASGSGPVDLRFGRDVVAAPDIGTYEDAATSALVVGDDGFRMSFTNGAAEAPWGRWETYIGQGGVSDPGTAQLLAEAVLLRAGHERVQRTRQITPHTARWLPWRDYRPGDRILAPGEAGAMESLRVRQMTVTRDEKGVLGGNLVLNDRLLERDLRLARRTAGIVGGSTAEGGSGARPAPESPTPRTPAAPAGLIVNPLAYIDEHGLPRGQVAAAWGAVITDVNAVALTVGGYELFMRINEVGAPWFLVTATEAADTNATYSPLVVGQQYQFKVRAVNLGKKGPFSSSVAVTIPDDVDAPPVPTAPALESRLGVVHVAWDGLGVGGVPMPADFHRVLVWMQDPLAPGWQEIGALDAAGSLVVPGLPYDLDREFSFTSIDRSGNSSARSATGMIAAVRLVEGDAADESITTGAIVANAITAAKIAAGQILAGHIAANQITAAKLEAILTLATRIVAGVATGARVELNADGLQAYNNSSVQTVSVSSASGAVSIVGQLATGVSGRRIIVNPAGAADPEIRFMPGTGTNSARIWTDTDAAIRLNSGNSPDGTRRSEVIQRGDEWRMHMVQTADGLAGGGYMFAQPDELEVGYNDIGGNLNRFRFSAASTGFIGKWSYSTSGAGLIMRAVSLSGGSAYNVTWGGPIMQTTPRAVFTPDNPIPDRLHFYLRNPSTSGFELRSNESSLGTPTVFAVLLDIWAWRGLKLGVVASHANSDRKAPTDLSDFILDTDFRIDAECTIRRRCTRKQRLDLDGRSQSERLFTAPLVAASNLTQDLIDQCLPDRLRCSNGTELFGYP